MKKLFYIMIAVILVVSLVACGGGSSSTASGQTGSQADGSQAAGTAAGVSVAANADNSAAGGDTQSGAGGENETTNNGEGEDIVRPETAGMQEILKYPGAAVQESFEGFIIMTTTDSLADVKAFYLEALKELGAEEQSVSEDGGWYYAGTYGEGWDIVVSAFEAEGGALEIIVNYAV